MTDTSTDLVLAPPRSELDTFQVAEHAWRLAQRVAKTEFVPKGLQGKPESVLAVVLKGHELDLPPMTALASIHVIQGRPGLSAELQRALVTRAGHTIEFRELTATRATCYGRRSDTGSELTVTWTMDDAKRAGLAGKDVWRAYPRNMLAARASAEVCRFLFADVIGGLRSTEELEDLDPDTEVAASAPAEPAVDPSAATTRKASAPTAAAKKSPARKRAARKAAAEQLPAPPPPALPDEDDDIVDAELVEDQDAPDPDVIERAKRIAMKANDLGLDRAEVIYAVTDGAATSGKALTESQALDVLDALRRLRLGELTLDTSGDAPVLREADEVDVATEPAQPPLTPVDEHVDWTAAQWRERLAAVGLKQVAFIKEAHALAEQTGEGPVNSLDDLAGKPSVTGLMLGWIEEQEAAG